MELGNKRKFLLRKFFNEYLDLNRSKEDEQLTVDAVSYTHLTLPTT